MSGLENFERFNNKKNFVANKNFAQKLTKFID